MFCKPNVGWDGGTLILCSTLLSIATAAPGAQNAMTPVETFTAPAFTQVNAKATPVRNKKIDLVFPLVFKKKAQLDALIQAQQDPTSPQYRQFLTPEQIGQRFGADEADLRAIVQYAQSRGFTITNVWPNRLFVSATANVAQVEEAFHIQLLGYNRPKEMLENGDPTTFFAPDRKPTIPADIAARITGIHGLSNFLLAHPALHMFRGKRLGGRLQSPPSVPNPGSQEASKLHSPTPNLFDFGLSPAQVSTIYNVDGLHNLRLNGQGMNIAVISPTQYYPGDVQTFATNYGISGYTIHEKWVSADGRVSDFNGSDEAALDCEMIIGQANEATITLYETDWDTDAHFIDALNQIAADHFPVVSCSWGFTESGNASDTSLVKSMDTALAAMAAAGQSIFSASGDSGADAGQTGKVGIIAPTDDPNVTSVGGTQDLNYNNDNTWASEQGWSGSGGGLSVFYTQPSWQTGPGVKNSYSNGMRQIPDVAALADQYTPGYNIYTTGTGGWGAIGGTSASTPLWAVATLLMDENTGHITRGIGNLAPLVYKLNSFSVNPAFHDITRGSNAVFGSKGEFPCTAGWDFVTGWGSADFTKLYNALNIKATITSFTPTSGPIGTVAIITGTHFTEAIAVIFNGTAATVFSVVSDTAIKATVPNGATTGTISVTTIGGITTSSARFTVTPSPKPAITSFTPTSGPIGTVVTITGTHFTGATAVKFNSTPATVFSVVSDTAIKATVPTGATADTISVTTPGGTATSNARFTVTTLSISGKVFNDKNGNGVQEAGDGRLAGWTVYIDLNGNGKLDPGEPNTASDNDGNYIFTGLNPGTYEVNVVPKSGWHESLPDARYAGWHVTLPAKNITNLDFGWTQSCTILGFVYDDQNFSGQYVTGDPLLSGWTIFIDLNGSHQPNGTNPTTTTDSTGIFEFDGLAPGTYNVRIVVPWLWFKSQPPLGVPGYSVPLTTSGQVSGYWEFGVY